ncbi:MAG: NAD(P)H-hydrate dehydratase [Pseudomonadota bacterium]
MSRYLVTAKEMREFDSVTIQEFGIPGIVLMENAGRATFEILNDLIEDDPGDINISVVAGSGNNGGDGYVIARYLVNQGFEVDTFLLSSRDNISGDAKTNLDILEKTGARIWEIESVDELDEAEEIWAESSVIIDAILGTGLKQEVKSPYREAIEKINGLDAFVLAVDIPSGIDSDTGKICGVAVEADITVTYGFQKLGMALYPGRGLCGQIEVVDISIPQILIDRHAPLVNLYDDPDMTDYFLLRSNPMSHKGDFGKILIVGGTRGKTGATAMAAKAASRIGAGLVTVAVPESLNPVLEDKLTEEMTVPVPDVLGYFDESSADNILELCSGMSCVAIGPGLSTRSGSIKIVETLLRHYPGQLVIDADGLNCLAMDLSLLLQTQATVVLTPHPGEMANLLGVTVRDVQENRFALGRRFSDEFQCWLVLKGASTITFSPYGESYINTTGNPWMSSGGQGDVLTGILAGLIGQKLPLAEAIPLGVWLHGFVADSIIEKNGHSPVLATDIISEIPAALRSFTEA